MNTPQDKATRYDWIYAILPIVVLWIYATPSRNEIAALKREVRTLEQQVDQLTKAVRP